MILLTFLGAGKRFETVYAYEGRQAPLVSQFQEAAARLFEPALVLAVATPTARKHENTPQIEAALAALDVPLQFVDIPDGRSEDEYWTMFEAVAIAVPEGAEVVLDVTHGFRSQPMLALAVAQYLTVTRGVQVQRIIYGAWEARDVEENVSPVFDLTPFLDLITWSVAARQFTRDGHADALADLLASIQERSYRQGSASLPRHAVRAGKALRALTDALAVIRPDEVLDRARWAADTLAQVEADLSVVSPLRPLRLLIEHARRLVNSLCADTLFSAAGFKAQAAMIRFYLDTAQLQQAVTLAREALVSHYAVAGGFDPTPQSSRRAETDAAEGRDAAELAINRLGLDAKRKKLTDPDEQALGDLWNQLAALRNDLNHAGMRPAPLPPERLVAQAHDLAGRVATRIGG